MADLLRPSLKFHQSADQADDNDLILYWDVRLVRGGNERIASARGQSSFPGVMGNKQIARLSMTLGDEITEKITVPLLAAIQELCEERAGKEQRIRLGIHEEPESSETDDLEDSLRAEAELLSNEKDESNTE